MCFHPAWKEASRANAIASIPYSDARPLPVAARRRPRRRRRRLHPHLTEEERL